MTDSTVTTGTPGRLIHTVAAVIADAPLDPAGRVLLVRKRGSGTFIQPGGKREPGEVALATLARELDEELGVAIAEAWPLGTFEDAAVHEPGCRVRAEAFAVRVAGTPAARAEIAEARWIDAATLDAALRDGAHGEDAARADLPRIAPLSRRHVLPAWRAWAAARAGA